VLGTVAEEGVAAVHLVPILEVPLKILSVAMAREASGEGVCRNREERESGKFEFFLDELRIWRSELLR
jgi:hypothetical protein